MLKVVSIKKALKYLCYTVIHIGSVSGKIKRGLRDYACRPWTFYISLLLLQDCTLLQLFYCILDSVAILAACIRPERLCSGYQSRLCLVGISFSLDFANSALPISAVSKRRETNYREIGKIKKKCTNKIPLWRKLISKRIERETIKINFI